MTKFRVTVIGQNLFDNYLKTTEVNFIKLLLNRSIIRKCPAQHLRFHVQGQGLLMLSVLPKVFKGFSILKKAISSDFNGI